MRIFAGEFICGGGLADCPTEKLPSGLLAEGRAMLQALCDDFSQVGEVSTVVDERLDFILPKSVKKVPFASRESMIDQWCRVAKHCDRCLIVAPETGGVLEACVSQLRQSGLDPVASSDEFILATSDKRCFARHLLEAGVPHPSLDASNECTRNWILKPFDGCGSTGIERFEKLEDAQSYRDRDSNSTDFLIQPLCSGQPVSITAIVSERVTEWLPLMRQHIDLSSFEYQGGSGPMPYDFENRARRLAGLALNALPGRARGYIGVDLVLGSDESEDVVIEVNPRLTTSYVGLRRLIKTNIGARMLGVDVAPLEWNDHVREVAWTPDGTVTTSG